MHTVLLPPLLKRRRIRLSNFTTPWPHKWQPPILPVFMAAALSPVSLMTEPFHNTRKRRQSPDPSQPEDAARCPQKKQKIDYPLRLPSAFWDSFGDRQIPLTRNALAEFNDRNKKAQSARCLPQVQVHRPVTRRLAGNGGPDLSDLRGVCASRILLPPSN